MSGRSDKLRAGGAKMPPAGGAAPALLPPVGRPGSETFLLVAAAVALQAIVWAFLIWLLRANGPWYHFFDVSDITVYFDYAQKVAALTGSSGQLNALDAISAGLGQALVLYKTVQGIWAGYEAVKVDPLSLRPPREKLDLAGYPRLCVARQG